MMIHSDNLIFHTVCPLMAIALFLFINSDHTLGFRSSFIAILPVFLYTALYLIMVFVIGEENGGWRDHYQVGRIMEHMPLPVIVFLLLVICLVLSNILRISHNAVHKHRKRLVEEHYQEANVYAQPDIDSAIRVLAQNDRSRDMGGELTVPRRIMSMMDKKYESGLSIEEMCVLYIKDYYDTETEK